SLTITVGGCTSAQSTVAVTVSNTPSAPTLGSNTPVCSGNSLNLTANTVVGGTYTWTGPNSFSSAAEDPTIASATTAATGTYSLTISVGGCTSPMSTISVTVNPTPAAPTVGSNSPICAGQTLNLTANTVVGATYAWTGPNSFSSTNEDPTIPSATTAATGTYSLTITLNGCVSAQSTVSVIVGTTPAAPTLGSNTPVCSGNSLNLTANTVVGGTYAWTGPNSFSSSNEDPTIPSATVAASGTYSLTISIGACSSPQSTISVTVNPTPAAPTVGSNTPVCSGNTLNLTANTVVGATYAWTGPNSFSSTNEDPTIPSATTAASGTYSLTITVGGCTSAQSTVAVTVNPTPATPTVGSNSPVCSGQTLNLTSNTVAGATYQTPSSPGPGSNTPICAGQSLNLTSNTVASATYSWTGPNSFSSTNEDPTISGATTAATGMYYVTVTVSGCTSPTDSVAVIVNPLPVVLAGSDVAICIGDSTPLSGTGTGTMVWSNASGLSCTNCSAPNASPAATTTYTLTLTDANGCVNTDDVIVTVNTLPVAVAGADAALCNGDSAVLNGSGGGTYSWLPATNLSNTSSATPTADPSVTTTYTLQVTDINGCQDTDAVVVTVNALPAVTAGPDQSMCPTGNVPLNVTGAQSYVWSPASGLTCTNCSNPVATPAVTTTYYVTGTDSNGCINNDTIVVTVAPNLVITASADQTICVGDSASLNTNGTGTYVWSPAGTLSNAGSQTPMAGPAVTTTYTITVTDLSGCSGTDSVTVFVNQPVVATAAGATTICIGQSASLSATATGGDGNYTYTWNPGALTGSPVSVSPTTTTTYSVDVTDSNGCADQQTVIVTVNPPITAAVSQSALSICTGGSTTLGASATGGNGVYSYTWSPATGLSSATAQNPVANPIATTTYTVVINDNCGSPVDSATVTVTVNSLPTVTASSLGAGGCAPFCTDFSGQSSGSCTSTLWDFGDGNTNTTSATPNHCFNLPGVYNSQFTCTDANGCSASSSVAITVTAPPVASFSVVGGTTVTLQSGTSVQVCFTDNSTGAVSWNWTFNSGTSTSQSPCFPVSDTGSYTAILVVTDAQGCTDSTAVTVNVENPCTDLFLPTAFSPNNDGQNDVLYLYGTCIKYMQLEIYSRWGERVFITNDPLIGWDGTWRGQACESAVFTYVLRATLSDDSQIEQQGNITLVK
ncbi:MAG: PKD domain-containing protein, partial [Bacteroidetes bacterium]